MADNIQTTMNGNPITLSGLVPGVGEEAPNFTALDPTLSPKALNDYAGKYKLISVVPSLDTGVCDAQTRRFNEAASGFSDDVVVLTISMDLPFAQARWCGAAGVDRVVTLSDHKDADFGNQYGLLIKELRLLNRSIFILDKNNIIRYREVVSENTSHPDYDAALNAFSSILEEA